MKKIFVQTLVILLVLNFNQQAIAQTENSVNPEFFLKNGVIAHRGAWKKNSLPQNSVASLKQAISIGVAGSEFDVQLTADEILVVNHDQVYQGMEVEKTNYSELAKSRLKNGEVLPRLEDFLEIGKTQQKTLLILELKPSVIGQERSILLAQKAVEKVKQLDAQKWIVFISFNYEILKEIIRLDEKAITMYLADDKTLSQLKTDGISGADYNLKTYSNNDQLIENAHKLGILTNAWTVNDSLLMDNFLARDIDLITTDEPEILLKKVSGNIHESKWQLVWYDEFNVSGFPDSTKWNYDTRGNTYGWGNNEAQWYTVANKNNTWIDNGILKITARNEPISEKQYSSGRLTTKGKGDWKYCKVEVRAKLPSGNGTWPAIWMLSSEGKYGGWPKSGEIDIMEHVGYDPDTVLSTVHTGQYNHIKGTQVGKKTGLATATTEFHVYTLEWDELELRSYVDNKLYFTFKNENRGFETWPFNEKFHLILNLAIGGGLGGKHGIDDSKFPHNFEVDYVRIYKAKVDSLF